MSGLLNRGIEDSQQMKQIKQIAWILATPFIAVGAAVFVLVWLPIAVIADGRLDDFFRPRLEYPPPFRQDKQDE